MQEKLLIWLNSTRHKSKNGKYFHLRLREDLDSRKYLIEDLTKYLQKAHEDAKSFFDSNTSYSLDPLEEDSSQEENFFSQSLFPDYPAYLPLQTLKGYFGEVFAGIVAEHFSPFEEKNWKVPAYLFRFHNDAFHYLEALRQTGRAKESIFGRTGDDCLAFTLKEGEIEKILYCEAKCTKDHDTEMIKEAHDKFNTSVIIDIYQVIEILKNNMTEESKIWHEALKRFLMKERKHSVSRNLYRYNLMTYVHGQLPKRGLSWLPETQPHDSYKAEHPLEAVEIHLHDIDDLICIVYNKERETPLSARI